MHSTICLWRIGVSVSLNYFFFSLLAPPPTSPLFPYTTLFRSPNSPSRPRIFYTAQIPRLWLPTVIISEFARSEEHTSELQSRGHLVCRLLLEKKKRSSKPHAVIFSLLASYSTSTTSLDLAGLV